MHVCLQLYVKYTLQAKTVPTTLVLISKNNQKYFKKVLDMFISFNL
jgi:hypothetical protein